MSHASRLSSSVWIALAISLILHALLAAVLALYLNDAPAPDELAQLDLTSVDLSFAEAVEDTAAAVASAPSAPVEPPPPQPRRAPAPGVPLPVDAASPPRQAEPRLPSPTEPAELLPPTSVRQEWKGERRETRDEKSSDERRETRDEKPPDAKNETRPAAPPRQVSAPRQARVDAPPKPRRNIRPDYPRESRLRGEHGDVTLELDVAADGSVSSVRILKSPGYPLLEEAAAKAARAARFTPARSGGRPVASTVRLTLTFKLK